MHQPLLISHHHNAFAPVGVSVFNSSSTTDQLSATNHETFKDVDMREADDSSNDSLVNHCGSDVLFHHSTTNNVPQSQLENRNKLIIASHQESQGGLTTLQQQLLSQPRKCASNFVTIEGERLVKKRRVGDQLTNMPNKIPCNKATVQMMFGHVACRATTSLSSDSITSNLISADEVSIAATTTKTITNSDAATTNSKQGMLRSTKMARAINPATAASEGKLFVPQLSTGCPLPPSHPPLLKIEGHGGQKASTKLDARCRLVTQTVDVETKHMTADGLKGSEGEVIEDGEFYNRDAQTNNNNNSNYGNGHCQKLYNNNVVTRHGLNNGLSNGLKGMKSGENVCDKGQSKLYQKGSSTTGSNCMHACLLSNRSISSNSTTSTMCSTSIYAAGEKGAGRELVMTSSQNDSWDDEVRTEVSDESLNSGWDTSMSDCVSVHEDGGKTGVIEIRGGDDQGNDRRKERHHLEKGVKTNNHQADKMPINLVSQSSSTTIASNALNMNINNNNCNNNNCAVICNNNKKLSQLQQGVYRGSTQGAMTRQRTLAFNNTSSFNTLNSTNLNTNMTSSSSSTANNISNVSTNNFSSNSNNNSRLLQNNPEASKTQQQTFNTSKLQSQASNISKSSCSNNALYTSTNSNLTSISKTSNTSTTNNSTSNNNRNQSHANNKVSSKTGNNVTAAKKDANTNSSTTHIGADSIVPTVNNSFVLSEDNSGYIVTPGRHRIMINEFLMAGDVSIKCRYLFQNPSRAATASYAQDMYNKWRRLETKIDSRSFQLSLPTDSVVERFRKMAIACIYCYAAAGKLSHSSIHMAISNIHRVLLHRLEKGRCNISDDLFAGTVISALRMAIKHEERPEKVEPIRCNVMELWNVSEFCREMIIDRSNETVNKIEVDCFNILNSPLSPPSTPEYVERYLTVGAWPPDLTNSYRELTVYFLALSTFASGESNCLGGIAPSLLAAGALVLAVKIINIDKSSEAYEFWPCKLETYTRYTMNDLKPVIRGLGMMLRNKPRESAILEKIYSKWAGFDWN